MKRINIESYRVRSTTSGYPGDFVESHTLVLGSGRMVDVSRVRWANGAVTVRAFEHGSAVPVHWWAS